MIKLQYMCATSDNAPEELIEVHAPGPLVLRLEAENGTVAVLTITEILNGLRIRRDNLTDLPAEIGGAA